MKQRANRTNIGHVVSVALLFCFSLSLKAETLADGLMSLDPAGVDAYIEGKYSVAFPKLLRDAQNEKVWGMYLVGEMLQKGEGVSLNYAEANKWFRRSAQKGNAEALASLGRSYENGLGVPENVKESLSLYRDAAIKGSTTAMLQLGLLHANGRGIPQDHSVAVRWYRACAEKGSVVWMLSYGNYLKSGLGTEKDLIAAYAWYNVAASRGGTVTDVAVSSRNEIARELTSEQLSKAQELSWQLSSMPTR